jgi:hypothetical protein
MGAEGKIYLFRDRHFAAAGDTVVSAAPEELVVQAIGGGGLHSTQVLSQIFGGAAIYRDERSGRQYLGAWGARKASRFRTMLQRRIGLLEIVRAAPPGRLVVYMDSRRSRRLRAVGVRIVSRG